MLLSNSLSKFKKVSKNLTISFALGIATISNVSAYTKLSDHTDSTAIAFMNTIKTSSIWKGVLTIKQDNTVSINLIIRLQFLDNSSEGHYKIEELDHLCDNHEKIYSAYKIIGPGEEGTFTIVEQGGVLYLVMSDTSEERYSSKLFSFGPLSELTVKMPHATLNKIALCDGWFSTAWKIGVNISPVENP